jgi:hypothetical protein
LKLAQVHIDVASQAAHLEVRSLRQHLYPAVEASGANGAPPEGKGLKAVGKRAISSFESAQKDCQVVEDDINGQGEAG